ncbi:hypothetical protein SteCoe_34633 [Stentor coeruleus]|uniref:Uncharacterized protein n=1 Tax=Stentor coeruleus TaxID=5963 RepID=A0A1R2AU37_9CILI|nr:hypothetical protein SteCoe_34633 [Stentor coeruleus]
MSFETVFEPFSDIYSLSISNFTKLSLGNSVELRKMYIQIIPTENYVLMQYNEGIDFFESDFETLIRNVPIKDILSLEVYNDLVYILYSNVTTYLSINSPILTYETNLNNQCNMMTFCMNYLICGDDDTISYYICIDTSCSFILSINTFNFLKIQITSLTSSYISSKNDCNIYILSYYIDLYILSFVKTLNNQIYADNLHVHIINPAYKIYATSLQLYAFSISSMTVYSFEMANDTTIYFNDMINRFHFLENFVYISTLNNQLIIVDGLEMVFRMVYLDIQLSDNCYYSSSWFIGNFSNTGIICSNETGYFLTNYHSFCPQQNTSTPCDVPFMLEFSIDYPADVDNYFYLYNVTFWATSQMQSVPLYVAFELLIFGQVIHYTESFSKTDISIYYDTGIDLTDILDGFTGNNLTFMLDINGHILSPQESENSPLNILPNVLQINNFTSEYEIDSIACIDNTPYIFIYDINSNLIFLNSSDFNETTQQMNVIGNISLSSFQKNLICASFQYISTKETSFLIAAICVWSYNFPYYWQSIANITENSNAYFITLFQINFKFELDFAKAFQLPFQPSQLKAISDDTVKLTILVVDYTINTIDSTYKNNRLYRAEFIWENTTLHLENQEIIDMFSLNLSSLYIYSIDGYYNKHMHIVIADKWNGVLILYYDYYYLETRVKYSIPSVDDPIYTVGVSYKMIYTVSKSGILATYALYNGEPVFSSNRYPFAHNTRISTIPSFITLNDFYSPQFLIYSVIYDRQGFYLRLANLEGTALNFLISDIEFSSSRNACMGSCPISAVFINETSFAFVYNMFDVKYYYINNYKLQVPIMTESEYKKMKEKWIHTNFTFRVIGLNENNNVTTGYYNLEILEYKKTGSDDYSTPIWIFPIISIGILIILIITVKLIYKIIFRRRAVIVVRNIDMITEDSIMSINSY